MKNIKRIIVLRAFPENLRVHTVSGRWSCSYRWTNREKNRVSIDCFHERRPNSKFYCPIHELPKDELPTHYAQAFMKYSWMFDDPLAWIPINGGLGKRWLKIPKTYLYDPMPFVVWTDERF